MNLLTTLLAALQFAVPPDSSRLATVAAEYDVPPAIAFAVAYMETRSNVNPAVRGPGREQCDSLGCRRVCREVGRFQINPCIMWGFSECKPASIRTYEGNVRCGVMILRAQRDGTATWVDAIRRYNGSGPKAREYTKEALAYIGWLTLRETK